MFIRMGESADLAGAAIKSLGEQILVDLGDAFIDAAKKAAHFYASLNEGTSANRMVQIVEINDEIRTLEESIENASTASGRLWNALTFNTSQEKFALEKINELKKQKIKLQEEEASFVNKNLVYSDESSASDDSQTGTDSVIDKKEEKLTEWLTRQEE